MVMLSVISVVAYLVLLLARTLSCTSLRAMTCSDQGDDVHQNGRS